MDLPAELADLAEQTEPSGAHSPLAFLMAALVALQWGV